MSEFGDGDAGLQSTVPGTGRSSTCRFAERDIVCQLHSKAKRMWAWGREELKGSCRTVVKHGHRFICILPHVEKCSQKFCWWYQYVFQFQMCLHKIHVHTRMSHLLFVRTGALFEVTSSPCSALVAVKELHRLYLAPTHFAGFYLPLNSYFSIF